jgi:hypothetical protein
VLRTTLYLSDKLHARLKNRAAATGISMSKLIERWAWEGLERDEQAGRTSQSEGRAPTSPDARP